MLFMIGIEHPKNNTQAYGIIVPVFEKYGYGCISAVDEQEQILCQAQDVILSMVKEMINNGISIKSLNEGYQNYQQSYPDFTQWLTIEVPVEHLISTS